MTLRDWLVVGGLFLCLLAGAAGWGRLGLCLLRRVLRAPEDSRGFPGATLEGWYLSLTLGMGLLSSITLFLGLTGVLYPAVAWGVLAVGAGMGLLWGRLPRSETDTRRREGRESGKWLQKSLAVVLALLGVSGLLYMLLVHTLMPPHEWDEISYHLALAKMYVDSHRITYVPFMLTSNWPMNTQMLFTLGLLLGTDLISHLVTFWMTMWTAWGLYRIGKGFLDRRVGWLAATLYLTVPLVERLSGTGLVDVSLAFYGTAAILAYARYCQARSPAWAGLSGLFCGLAAGCKLTGGAFLLIVGFLIILDALRAPRLNWCSLLICLTLFGGLGLLMVGPWYARSYAFTGNPVWPFLYQVFGGEDWDWLGHEYNTQCLQKMWVVDLPLSPKGVWLSLRYLFFEPFRLGGYSGGLGQVLLGLASLSVLTLRRAPRLVYNLFLMVVLYYAMWFLFVSHQVRYLFPILPPLTLLGAFAFYALWDRLRLPALRWIMAGALLFFLGRDSPWIQPGQRNLTMNRLPYVTGRLSREVFLDEQIDVMPALRYMNTSLPPDAVVLLLPYETRGYYLDRRYIWGHPIAQRIIRFEEYDSPEELAEDLQALGITHILDSPGWLYTELRYWEHDHALMLALESRCGVQVARWQDIVLYQLVECRD